MQLENPNPLNSYTSSIVQNIRESSPKQCRGISRSTFKKSTLSPKYAPCLNTKRGTTTILGEGAQ